MERFLVTIKYWTTKTKLSLKCIICLRTFNVFICGFAEGTVDSSSNAGETGIWEGEHVQFLNESGSEEIVMGYGDKTI